MVCLEHSDKKYLVYTVVIKINGRQLFSSDPVLLNNDIRIYGFDLSGSCQEEAITSISSS